MAPWSDDNLVLCVPAVTKSSTLMSLKVKPGNVTKLTKGINESTLSSFNG